MDPLDMLWDLTAVLEADLDALVVEDPVPI